MENYQGNVCDDVNLVKLQVYNVKTASPLLLFGVCFFKIIFWEKNLYWASVASLPNFQPGQLLRSCLSFDPNLSLSLSQLGCLYKKQRVNPQSHLTLFRRRAREEGVRSNISLPPIFAFILKLSFFWQLIDIFFKYAVKSFRVIILYFSNNDISSRVWYFYLWYFFL